MPEFSQLKSEYARLWSTMIIRPDKRAAVDSIARRLLRDKLRYVAVELKTAVPWFVIAALHNRESDADFATYLGNGEPLDRVTRLVPKGRGPFATWGDGAVDALRIDGLDKVKDWTPERACFEIEKFNGFGYRNHGFSSPYLWSFTDHYTRGKYVADGRFSATHVDRQCGAIPIIKRIMELDDTARLEGSPSPITEPVVITGTGGILGALAHFFGASPQTLTTILIVTVIAAGVAYIIARSRS